MVLLMPDMVLLMPDMVLLMRDMELLMQVTELLKQVTEPRQEIQASTQGLVTLVLTADTLPLSPATPGEGDQSVSPRTKSLSTTLCDLSPRSRLLCWPTSL